MAYEEALTVLSDPTRRAVFEKLRAGPLAVSALAKDFPVSRPAISQHLGVLKAAGLVEDRAEGTRRIYAIRTAPLKELRDWLDSFWGEALDAYKTALENEGEDGHGQDRTG